MAMTERERAAEFAKRALEHAAIGVGYAPDTHMLGNALNAAVAREESLEKWAKAEADLNDELRRAVTVLEARIARVTIWFKESIAEAHAEHERSTFIEWLEDGLESLGEK